MVVNGGSSHSVCSTASGSVMCPPLNWARNRGSVSTMRRTLAMRFAVVSYAAMSTSRRCWPTSSSVRPAGCSVSQVAKSSSGATRRRATSLFRAAITYALDSMAVSVPLIMSRAASTSRSLYSSGMPMICAITIIGRCSANRLTRSALPSWQNSLTRRLLYRLM